MIKSYLTVYPWTRMNDDCNSASMNTTPVSQSIKHELISTVADKSMINCQEDFYKFFALDIVTETMYNYPYPYVSEKTLKPIACKRMFIVVGAAGILDLLHQKGFSTFPDVIDESYDCVDDPNERWLKVTAAIKNFVTTPVDEVKEILISQKTKLDKNFEILRNLQKVELMNLMKLP